MDLPCFLAIVVLVLFVYSIVPWTCTESFTVEKDVKPTGSCPNGGKVDGNSCTDRVPGTYECAPGSSKHSDGLCYGPDGVRHPSYYCPNKYNYNYSTNDGICVRGYGKVALSCPQGYTLKHVEGKGMTCAKES